MAVADGKRNDKTAMNLNNKTILVTGGAGFIGSYLVEHLIERGISVVVLDNFRQGTRANLSGVLGCPRLRVVHGDITDRDTCLRVCRDVDVVFHLAAVGVRHSLHNPVENHQVNALGSLYVLEAARTAKVRRFVYMSTSEVYGRVTEFPIRETTATWPLTIYGSSKLAGEHYARSYFESFGLPAVCVRPFNNYGARSHFEGDAGEAIPRFILRVLNGQPPVVFGDGKQTRDFLYVSDCAETLARIAECDGLVGQVVNLGYGEEVRILKLARMVLDVLDCKHLKPVHEIARPADVRR